MSASEKLWALTRRMGLSQAGVEYEVPRLVAAIPQIAAVIEEAEALPDFFTTDDGRVQSFVLLLDELDKALS